MKLLSTNYADAEADSVYYEIQKGDQRILAHFDSVEQVNLFREQKKPVATTRSGKTIYYPIITLDGSDKSKRPPIDEVIAFLLNQ